MVIAVGFAVWCKRGWRAAALQTAPLGAIYLVWFLVIGHEGYGGRDATVGDGLGFIADAIRSAFVGMGNNGFVAVLLGGVLVIGLTLLVVSDPSARDRIALPGGLLAGALAFLVITSAGRSGLALASAWSRYIHVVAALTLPAIALAIDQLTRRWAWFLPIGLVVLVAGIPGNIHEMRKRAVFSEGAREFVLSLPRVPVAEQIPPNTRPDPVTAPDMTIGWLRAGVGSGKIPAPSEPSARPRALATLVLALQQVEGQPQDDCAPLDHSVTKNLSVGDRVTVRNAPVRASLERAPAVFRVFDPALGNTITARGPISVTLTSSDPARPAVVCG
jgi:hypothetical protein